MAVGVNAYPQGQRSKPGNLPRMGANFFGCLSYVEDRFLSGHRHIGGWEIGYPTRRFHRIMIARRGEIN